MIKDLTIYKSKGAAIWARGENHIFDGLKIADSAIGYTHAYPGVAPYHGDYTSKVLNSLFVGESDNKGTPKTPAEIKYGRTMPRTDADYPVRGYEYYDFTHHVSNTKFVNYVDNDTRKAGALSYLLFTSFGVSTNNSIEKLTFENAKPAYFPPTERRWQFTGEYGSFSGWNGAVIHDKDGSATGMGPNSYIVIDNGIAFDEKRCEMKQAWGAAVCKGDMGRMGITAAAPGGGRGGPGGPGAAKGAPAALAAAPGGPGAAKGGPGGPGAAKGAPAAPGGRGAANPIVLSRNGRKLNLTGQLTVLAGTEVRAESEAPTLNVQVSEMDPGSWMIVELPGYTTAASGETQGSLQALRSATSNSYFKGEGSLWVKVIANGGGMTQGTAAGRGGLAPSSIQVSR